jgi:hypothetical protein
MESLSHWTGRAIAALCGAALGVLVGALNNGGGPEVIRNVVYPNPDKEDVSRLLYDAMSDTSLGRKNIAAIYVEINHCRMEGSSAKKLILPIAATERARVDRAISDVGSLTDVEAKQMLARYTTAVDLSVQSEKAYMAWLDSWAADDFATCTLPFKNPEWNTFAQLDEDAKDRKTAFLELFNSVAAEWDLKWTGGTFF